MAKIKYILLLICVAGCLSACKKNLGFEEFDVQGQFDRDTTAIRAFAIKNNIPVVKDEKYNFFYQIIEPGAGEEVTEFNTVSMTYTGRLLDGTVFDLGSESLVSLSEAISGWQLGIPLINKGGKIRLLLPSYHGFGTGANDKIPANSVLDFEISVIDVK